MPLFFLPIQCPSRVQSFGKQWLDGQTPGIISDCLTFFDFQIGVLFWIIVYLRFYPFFSSRYNVQAVFKVSESNGWDVKHLASSEVRIIILYCTRDEASDILGEKIISTRKGIKVFRSKASTLL